MFTYRRPVRFAEVDAARLVFFPRFLEYCHDALEALFAELPGGYAHLTQVRDIGIPTVRVEMDFAAPLRYGDVAIIEIEVLEVGRTSVRVRHTIRREHSGGGGSPGGGEGLQPCDPPAPAPVCAIATHVFVTTRLTTLEAVSVPEDVRAILKRHSAQG